MHYEIITEPGHTEDYIIACESCTTLLLSQVPQAASAREPLADYCQLQYEGVCDDESH